MDFDLFTKIFRELHDYENIDFYPDEVEKIFMKAPRFKTLKKLYLCNVNLRSSFCIVSYVEPKCENYLTLLVDTSVRYLNIGFMNGFENCYIIRSDNNFREYENVILTSSKSKDFKMELLDKIIDQEKLNRKLFYNEEKFQDEETGIIFDFQRFKSTLNRDPEYCLVEKFNLISEEKKNTFKYIRLENQEEEFNILNEKANPLEKLEVLIVKGSNPILEDKGYLPKLIYRVNNFSDKNLKRAEELDIEYNSGRALIFESDKIKKLKVTKNGEPGIISGISNSVEELYLKNVNIGEAFKFRTLTNLKKLTLENVNIENINLNENKRLEELKIIKCNSRDNKNTKVTKSAKIINLEKFDDLKSVELIKIKLLKLKLDTPKLQKLKIKDCNIINLEISGCELESEHLCTEKLSNIETIEIEDTKIEKIIVKSEKLKKISVINSYLKGFNIDRCKNIETLNLRNNELTEVRLKGLNFLKDLNLSYNHIENIDLNLENLENLNLKSNLLKKIRLNCKNLLFLNISDNKLENRFVKKMICPNVIELFLQGNNLDNFEKFNFKKLLLIEIDENEKNVDYSILSELDRLIVINV